MKVMEERTSGNGKAIERRTERGKRSIFMPLLAGNVLDGFDRLSA